MYEKDFVLEEEVEFEIEGRKFIYKPVTAGDELKWVQEYIEIIDGKAVQNYEKKTICKLRNLIKVPYDIEMIQKVIGVEKEWENLSKEERSNFIKKLNPKIFDKIIRKINEIDSSEDLEVKKN